MKLLVLTFLTVTVAAAPTVHNAAADVQFVGFERNGVEVFLGIPYGQDTGGQNRFKPPQLHVPAPGSVINATKPGHACPQQLGQWNAPLTLLNVTREDVSEDCLNLNIVRPKINETTQDARGNPVMLWIHGGSFWVGSNMEPTHMPDSLVSNSVDENDGRGIIHVAINYCLGLFGFAQSDALKKERSENAGLRDQRLAIEWVRDNIHYFGGDGNSITIFGQSSGGLAVGLQLLAFGGEKELPYQQGICQSQALEPGITGNFTRDAMTRVIEYVGCNTGNSSTNSPEVIACLRGKDTQTLYDASAATYFSDIGHNIGDIWLPSVDGDFLPAAPSTLIEEGRFGNATYMFGWTQGDVNYFTDVNIRNETDAISFLERYLPEVERRSGWGPFSLMGQLLKMYEASDFTPPAGSNLTSDFFRTAMAFRDILMVCEPLLLAQAINKKGNPVYLYNFNQTILKPILESVSGIKGLGVVHTSEFAYIYGNLSHYNVSGYPFNPTEADYALARRASQSWASFALSGNPTLNGGLQRWFPAYWTLPTIDNLDVDRLFMKPGRTYVYTIGGPSEGFWSLGGADSNEAMGSQVLEEKCAFVNDPGLISYLQF